MPPIIELFPQYGISLQEEGWNIEQIIEITGVGSFEPNLISRINFSHTLSKIVTNASTIIFRRDQLVFAFANGVAETAHIACRWRYTGIFYRQF